MLEMIKPYAAIISASTPLIVESIPYDDIRETPVITAEELKKRLN